MQKLLFLIGLVVFPITAIAENLLINPSFDEAPWNTGWTKCHRAMQYPQNRNDRPIALNWAADTHFYSPPYSCKFFASFSDSAEHTYKTLSGEGIVSTAQKLMKKVTNCTCRVYHCYNLFATADSGSVTVSCGIYVCVNGKWRNEWEIELSDTCDTIVSNWSMWEKIYSDTDTIMGIQFFSYSRGNSACNGGCKGESVYWVDDVYIGGTESGDVDPEPDGILVNPRFDEIPWDTGWSWTYNSPGLGYGNVSPDTQMCWSYPRSCQVYTIVNGTPRQPVNYHLWLWQEIEPITSCTCRFCYTYDCISAPGYKKYLFTRVDLDINGNWESFSLIPFAGESPGWIKWEHSWGPTDTLRKVVFYACAGAVGQYSGSRISLWIDNINISGIEVGIEENSKSKMQNAKLEVFPNPFIQKTSIRYSIPNKQHISLKIYDIAGRCVKTLVNGKKEPGCYKIDWDTKELGTGIYFATLTTANHKLVKKVILIK